MDSPWRRTLTSVFIILSLNDVAVFSQYLLPPGGPLLLPPRNRECAKPCSEPPTLITLSASNGVLPDSIPIFRSVPQEVQRALQESLGLPPFLNVPFNAPPCPQAPISTPLPQCIPPSTSSSSFPFPIVSASLIPPGVTPAPIVPSPALTLSQNLITTAPLPPDLLSVSYPVSSTGGGCSIPFKPAQLMLGDNLPLMSSDMYFASPSSQIPTQNYPPILLQPGTAKIIPPTRSNAVITFDNYPSSLALPDVDVCPSNFQITSLPPVFSEPLDVTGMFVFPSGDSSSNSVEKDSIGQLPISLQINMPPAPAPVVSIISALPPLSSNSPFLGSSPFGMYSPMVIGGSRPKRKSWLPILLIALLTSDGGCWGGGGGCDCCCPCDFSDPIPIPYPIPIPTNNPIIVNKSRSRGSRGSKNGGRDECDKKECDSR